MESNNNKLIGTGILVAGFVLLFAQITGYAIMSLLWPLWVIAPGAIFLYFGFKDHQAQIGFAIPGTVIVGTGLILAFMNIFGHWEAWSYTWALYPAIVGVAFLKVGERNHHEKSQKTGNLLIRIGLYTFIGFGLFFEALIFGGLSSAIVPIALIAIGAYMISPQGMTMELPIKQKRKVNI